MAYIVGDACVKCKYTDCVAVCPVDCFYVGENTLVIHPDDCIDCGACEPECPTTAIFEETELPEGWEVYTSINAVFSGAKLVEDLPEEDIKSVTRGWPEHLVAGIQNAPWPNIVEQQDPLPDADEWAKKTGNPEENAAKLAEISPLPGS